MTCARCAALEAELLPHRMRERLDLSPGQALILAALYRASPGFIQGDRLQSLVPLSDHAKGRACSSIRVYIYHLRATVGRGGLKTVAGVGVGYALTAQGKADLDEMLA